MRNLKRALSLALASVMLLGMMVVGTSAASYPDVDEKDNVEAIEVLNAVNVMIGDRGNFRPDAAVNRHEMATIMAKLVLGVETADNYVGTHPFTDVFPWADKYVAACYENGLVAGTSATTFGGNQPLTAVQAAAMMLRALGYKDLSKGATDWRAPVTAMANQIRLFNGVASNPSEQLTRNQVAQLALNTLKSPMVNLKDNTISWTDGEGQVIITGGGREYIALSSNEAYAKAINDTEKAGTSASQISGYTVELGEHLYNGKLKLNNNNLDVFGRPSRKWEFDGKEIGSYIKEELMVMDKVGKVTGNDLYTLLGASTIKDYDTLVTIDGIDNQRDDAQTILGNAYFDEADMNRNNKDKVGETGTGVLTQVFVDHEKDEVYVAIINTYLARASRDYDDKGEEATLTVYGIDEYRTSKEYVKAKGSDETMKVQNEDFALVKDVKKDDPYLVTVADGEIQTMVADEVLEGVTLSAFKLGDHVVSDGTEYAYTTTATYDAASLDAYTGGDKTNLKDITYNIYLDAYGNLIGIKEIDAVKNYVFLAGIDVDGSNLYSKTATANALFLDGTSKTIKINLSKSDFPAHKGLNTTNVVISGDALLNTWCTYTVNGDMYTVKEVPATYMSPYETENEDGTSGGNTVYSNNNYPQNKNYNDTKLAQTWQAAPVYGKTVDVKNMRLYGHGTDGKYINVYGDSTSVYLTAELDELFNDGSKYEGTNYGIIKGVDSVTTGIADTSIEVWDVERAQTEADNAGGLKADVEPTAHGIYTLYNSDGIVIASVIVGENEGVKDLVYVHSGSLDLESYDSAKDTWTWTRKVIYNGEEITLTEKGSGVGDLETMKQYQWYEIKRNADGDIIDADPAFNALGSYRVDEIGESKTRYKDEYGIYDTTGYFVDLYSDINKRVETSTKDTVLYQTNGGPQNYTKPVDPDCYTHNGLDAELKVIGSNTLAVETLTGSGIHFRNNVNVVLQYWNQNTKQTEVETGTGVDRLKSMVDFVNDNTAAGRGGDNYYLSAVIEKGFATTIVIYDSYNNYDRPDHTGNQELRLYGNLFNAANYTTDRYDAVVTVDGEELEPVRRGSDEWGGYAVYSVKSGATVGINDKDIDYDFDYLTNLVDIDPSNVNVKLRVLYRQNSISFVMPRANAFIIGADNAIEETIVGVLGEDSSLDNIQATFAGQAENRPIANMSAGDKITVNLSTLARALVLKADTKYTITLGEPASTVKVTSTATGTISFEYTLTHTDIRNGYVKVEKIVEGWDGEPVEPGDPDVKVTGVTLDKKTLSLEKDKTGTLTATVEPKDAGNKTVSWSTSDASVATVKDGVVTAVAKGTADITVITTDGNFTATCKVTVTETTSGGDFTVETKNTEAPFTFTVKYSGEAPSDEAAILAKINEVLAKIDPELKAAGLGNMSGGLAGVKVYNADSEQIGVIAIEGTFALYVNGTKVEGVELKTTATANLDVDLTGKVTGVADYLIAKDTVAATTSAAYAVTKGLTSQKITITSAALQALTEDLYLVNGYELVAGTAVGLPEYTLPDGKTTGTAAANNLFPNGTKFVFTGTKTIADGTNVKFTLGEYTDTKEAAAAALKWTVTFDAAKMLDENSQIKGVEEATTVTTLKIGNNSWTITGALGTKLTVPFKVGTTMPAAGKYVNTTTGAKHCAAAKVVSIAANGDDMEITFDAAPTPKDGVITLAPAVSLTFNSAAKADFGGTGDATVNANDEFYVVEGTTATFVFTTAPAVTDKALVSCDGKALREEIGKGPFTYAIPTNLTAPQKTAGLEIDQVVAVGAITYTPTAITDSTNEAAVKAFFTGDSVDNNHVTITVTGADSLTAGETSDITVTIVAAEGYYFAKDYKIGGVSAVDVEGVPTITIKIQEVIGS